MAIKELSESWWAKLTPEQRKAYIAKHPKSKRVHTQVKPGVAKADTEQASSNALDMVKDAGLKILKEEKKEARGMWYHKVHILRLGNAYLDAREKLIKKLGQPSASTIGDTRWNMRGFKVYLREAHNEVVVSVYFTL